MNVEDSATGIGSASHEHDDRPPQREVGGHHVGPPSREHVAQVGHLVGDRLDQPVAQQRQQAPAARPGRRPAPASTARIAAGTARSWSTRLEAEELEALPLDRARAPPRRCRRRPRGPRSRSAAAMLICGSRWPVNGHSVNRNAAHRSASDGRRRSAGAPRGAPAAGAARRSTGARTGAAGRWRRSEITIDAPRPTT